MPFAPFQSFPDDARLWLFAFSAPLDLNHHSRLNQGFEAFKPHWKTHGELIDSEWMVLENQILAVVERTMGTNPSGCSIDAMLRHTQKMAQAVDLDLVDAQQVVIRQGPTFRILSKNEIPALIESGELNPEIQVLDLGLLELSQLRGGKLTRRLEDTWIGRKYKAQFEPLPTAN